MAQQQQPKTPGEFTIAECTIQTFTGAMYDINDKWVLVDIFESIYSPSLELILTIQDGVGLLETLPLIGEEKVFLTYYTSDATRAIRRLFYTYKINNIVDTAHTTTTYQLHCCSPESILNTRLRVYNSYGPLPYSEMAKKVYSEYFGQELNKIFSPEYNKNFNVEDTKESYTISVPGMHPFDAMSLFAKRSITLIDSTIPGSLFFFWETTHGHYFRSLETIMTRYRQLMEEGATRDIPTYKLRPKNLYNEDNPSASVNPLDFATIDDIEHVNYFDTLKNMEEGMYSRKLIGHNLLDMKVEQHEYFYDRDGFAEGHTKKNGILASVNSIGLAPHGAEKKGSKHNKFAHVEYFPLSGSTRYNNAGKWKLHRGSQVEQLASMVLKITIPGDDRVEAGTCINVELPSKVPYTESTKEVLRSGGYLVTRIHHNFQGGDYKMKLDIVKDSYEIPLNNLVEEPNIMQQLHPVTLKPLPANETMTPSTVPGRSKSVNSDESKQDPQVYRIYSYAADNDVLAVGPRKTEKQSSDERISQA